MIIIYLVGVSAISTPLVGPLLPAVALVQEGQGIDGPAAVDDDPDDAVHAVDAHVLDDAASSAARANLRHH